MSGLLPSNPHHPAFYTTLRCDVKILVTTYANRAWVSIYSRLWLNCVKLSKNRMTNKTADMWIHHETYEVAKFKISHPLAQEKYQVATIENTWMMTYKLISLKTQQAGLMLNNKNLAHRINILREPQQEERIKSKQSSIQFSRQNSINPHKNALVHRKHHRNEKTATLWLNPPEGHHEWYDTKKDSNLTFLHLIADFQINHFSYDNNIN